MEGGELKDPAGFVESGLNGALEKQAVREARAAFTVAACFSPSPGN